MPVSLSHILRRHLTPIYFGVLASMVTGCSISDLVNQSDLPPDQRDPAALKTPAGALAAYRGALLSFASTLGAKEPKCDNCTPNAGNGASFIYVTGLLSDELSLSVTATVAQNGFPTSTQAAVDSRTATENDNSAIGIARAAYYKDIYSYLQTIRARTHEARGALRKYAPAQPVALIGHLYALEAYSEVLLAELFCSGIPLSTLDFESGFTYTRGFTTDEVFRHAIARFDSALVLVADSVDLIHFANMGRSRALLGLGEYAAAAQGVANVPTSYRYNLIYATTRANMFLASTATIQTYPASEGHLEGINGLPYWGDPRSDTVRTIATSAVGDFRMIPRKFIPPGTVPTTVTIGGVTYPKWVNTGLVPIPIATGLEARLIEAEAALKAGNANWLTTLNQLRTTCVTATGCPTPAPAGSGGVAGLPPLANPATDSGQISLLFKERAHWLFLTGYRQGDLRRLVRQYGRLQEDVYPDGPWGPNGIAPYGTDTNAPVPIEEQQLNPLYGGCINRDA